MNKKIKGYELMKLIAEKQIKSGTKFKDLTDNNYADDSNIYRYENNNFIGRWGGTNILLLLKHDFEILEDEEEIDIQKLELFEEEYIKAHDICMTETELDLIFKTNAIIIYLQQLDKKINKEET